MDLVWWTWWFVHLLFSRWESKIREYISNVEINMHVVVSMVSIVWTEYGYGMTWPDFEKYFNIHTD
jgi:hypothetical protein